MYLAPIIYRLLGIERSTTSKEETINVLADARRHGTNVLVLHEGEWYHPTLALGYIVLRN